MVAKFVTLPFFHSRFYCHIFGWRVHSPIYEIDRVYKVKNKGIDIKNIVFTGHYNIKIKFLGVGAHCEIGHSFLGVTPEKCMNFQILNVSQQIFVKY